MFYTKEKVIPKFIFRSIISVITILSILAPQVIIAGPIIIGDIGPPINLIPKIIENLDSNERVPNTYIIIYNDDAIAKAKRYSGQTKSTKQINEEFTISILKDSKSDLTAIYGSAVNGAALYNTDQSVIEALLNDSRVDQIYANTYVYSSDYDDSPQTSPMLPWGLDRVDQTSSILNSEYHFANTGSGVNVFVVDTGIDQNHPEFRGRNILEIEFRGETCIDASECNVTYIPFSTDSNGHGTHVAGIIAGETYGVAKDVNLYSYKIFTGVGITTMAVVVNALDRLHDNIEANNLLPAIVNMSFGGAEDHSIDLWPLDEALMNLSILGVHLVGAAGNSNQPVAGHPAIHEDVISVGATATLNSQDLLAFFSNYDAGVDIYAPGESIISAAANSSTSIILSGTSQATPFVVGAIALYLQDPIHRLDSPSDVKTALLNSATTVSLPNTQNGLQKLLNTTALTPAASQFQADDYDNIAIRGYSDDLAGDAEPLSRNESQDHNFHDSGDTDWVIFAMPSSSGNEIITEQLGAASAKLTAYQVNGFPSETSSGSGRWNISLNQLIEIDRDDSSGNNSVILHNTTSETQAYVVKVTGTSYGSDSQYKISSSQNDPVIVPDDYDNISVRGYTDDSPGDAEPLSLNESQDHNFHDSGDTDWIIFALPSGGGNEIITEQLGAVSAKLTGYQVNGFPSETSPGSGRWNISLNQLIEIDRDDSSGNNSVILHNTTSETQAYVVKVTGTSFGSDSQYRISSSKNDPVIAPDDFDNLNVRGYTDNVPGDAEPLSRNQSQIHNFHNSGDVDWIIFAMNSGSGNEISTTQLGLASAKLVAYQVNGFPAETSPGSKRWVISTDQLIEIDRDLSTGNNSVVLQNVTGQMQAYVVKVFSSGDNGFNTSYSISSTENNP